MFGSQTSELSSKKKTGILRVPPPPPPRENIFFFNEINSPHFSKVYWCNILRGILGEHEKNLHLSRVESGLLLNAFTPKILVVLLIVCHTVLVILVWRIWYWINL